MSPELSAFLLVMAVKGWLWAVVFFLFWKEEKRAFKAAMKGWHSCADHLAEAAHANSQLHEANTRLMAIIHEHESKGEEWKDE